MGSWPWAGGRSVATDMFTNCDGEASTIVISPAIDWDMGWSSCDTRRKVAIFRYWNRLIDMDDSRLQKIVFKWDIDLDFINSWSKNVESLLTKLDLSEKFIYWQPV